MRVNARFEGVAEQQVEYLVKTTGRGVSEVLRDSVAAYYQSVRGEQGAGLKYFSAVIGKGNSGRTDLSVNDKEELAQGWSEKHGLNQRNPVGAATTSNKTLP